MSTFRRYELIEVDNYHFQKVKRQKDEDVKRIAYISMLGDSGCHNSLPKV